jgi:hypothetical protein
MTHEVKQQICAIWCRLRDTRLAVPSLKPPKINIILDEHDLRPCSLDRLPQRPIHQVNKLVHVFPPLHSQILVVQYSKRCLVPVPRHFIAVVARFVEEARIRRDISSSSVGQLALHGGVQLVEISREFVLDLRF